MLYRASSALCAVLSALLLAAACSGGAPAGPGAAPAATGQNPGADAAPPAASGGGTGGTASPGPAPSGTAGAGGQGGSDAGGAVTGGNPAAPDTAGPAPAPDPGASKTYTCNLVLGIKETGEWFNAGFESIVDNARWEVVPVHNGHIELWADPQSNLWSMAPMSACTMNAKAPERVVFVGTNYDYTTTEEFVPKYTAVINNIKARYPSVKRVDLMTYVRAPGNVACPGNLSFKTVIKPAQDEAMDLVGKSFSGFVFVTPKFEVRSCADFAMPPHFTGAAAAAAAKKIGEHFLVN